MNSFEPKEMQKAAHYLQDKLDLFKKGGALPQPTNAYILDDKKDTMFQRFVGSIFSK